MAKEMANLMALARKPATKLQQTDTSLGEPRKWSNTTLRWVVAPTAIVAAAEVMLEVEFAGDNPAGGTSEDGVHRDCKFEVDRSDFPKWQLRLTSTHPNWDELHFVHLARYVFAVITYESLAIQNIYTSSNCHISNIWWTSTKSTTAHLPATRPGLKPGTPNTLGLVHYHCATSPTVQDVDSTTSPGGTRKDTEVVKYLRCCTTMNRTKVGKEEHRYYPSCSTSAGCRCAAVAMELASANNNGLSNSEMVENQLHTSEASTIKTHQQSKVNATDVWYFIWAVDSNKDPGVMPVNEPHLTCKPHSKFVACQLCSDNAKSPKWKVWKLCDGMTSHMGNFNILICAEYNSKVNYILWEI
ncbi:hypothetical protein EDC04DRAFT_2612574 [Pisolithus marmoratus]|nr:hypothetical protein EDC04DRAFT_2612574 [Pisolithus marmoratus]